MNSINHRFYRVFNAIFTFLVQHYPIQLLTADEAMGIFEKSLECIRPLLTRRLKRQTPCN